MAKSVPTNRTVQERDWVELCSSSAALHVHEAEHQSLGALRGRTLRYKPASKAVGGFLYHPAHIIAGKMALSLTAELSLTYFLFLLWLVTFILLIYVPGKHSPENQTTRRANQVFAFIYTLLVIVFLYNLWSIVVIYAGGIKTVQQLNLDDNLWLRLYRLVLYLCVAIGGCIIGISYAWSLFVLMSRARCLWTQSNGDASQLQTQKADQYRQRDVLK